MLLPPLDVVACSTFTMGREAYASRLPRPSSTASSASSSSSTSSRAYTASPDFPSIQKLVHTVFRSSNITVQQAERVRSRIYQVYSAKLADDSSFVLKCLPAETTRLLRHERHTFDAEVKTLGTLHEYTQLPVPRIIKYDDHGGLFGSPFLMMSHLPGRKLLELAPHLTSTERNTLDRTLGSYVRSLSSLSATQFGLIHRVFEHKGCKAWRQAFLALLEGALRDGEDILVTIPYDSIRYYVTKHAHILEEVTEPRLVALDLCRQDNILVDENTKRITGLVGFSNVIWGDPLLSGGIANGSEAFFEGFGECPVQTGGVKIRMLM
jgi:aminoglycoside phosphotransferase (APT) family kinase protein